jgi:hypothetical protein
MESDPVLDLDVEDVSDIRWDDMVTQVMGPEAPQDYIDQCGSCGTTYVSNYYCGQNTCHCGFNAS